MKDPGFEVYSQLLKKRIVMLGQEIDEDITNLIVAQLLYLESEDPRKDIQLYINSPGGSVNCGMAIFDTIQHIQPDVSTVCMGLAAGMAAFLLASGAKGKRYSIRNSRIAFTPLTVGVQSDIALETQAQEIADIKDIVDNIWAKNTGQPLQKIQEDTESDYYMSPAQANDYGLIDRTIDRNQLSKIID
jgi:ATP-dependent Clp protease, protease subunit